jgi:anti-anti-sigma factor
MGSDHSPVVRRIDSSVGLDPTGPALLSVSARTVDDRLVVAVKGELDIATVPLLTTVLDVVIDSSTCPIEFDLDGVRFLGVAAVRVLHAAARRCASAGRTFSLLNADEQMRLVLGVFARHAREPAALTW